jgi:hypothetical protein
MLLHPHGSLQSEDGAVMIGVRRDAEGFHAILPPAKKYTPGGRSGANAGVNPSRIDHDPGHGRAMKSRSYSRHSSRRASR